MLASNPYGCHRDGPLAHPWEPKILDVACGYDDKFKDPRCPGCYRRRDDNLRDQLAQAAHRVYEEVAHLVKT